MTLSFFVCRRLWFSLKPAIKADGLPPTVRVCSEVFPHQCLWVLTCLGMSLEVLSELILKESGMLPDWQFGHIVYCGFNSWLAECLHDGTQDNMVTACTRPPYQGVFGCHNWSTKQMHHWKLCRQFFTAVIVLLNHNHKMGLKISLIPRR